jgi:cell division protein FtsB
MTKEIDKPWLHFKEEMRDPSSTLNTYQKEIKAKLQAKRIPIEEIEFAVHGYQSNFLHGERKTFWKGDGEYKNWATPLKKLVDYFIPSILNQPEPVEELTFRTAFIQELFLFLKAGYQSGKIKSDIKSIDVDKNIYSSISQNLDHNIYFSKVHKDKVKNRGKNEPIMKEKRELLKELKKQQKENKKLRKTQEEMLKDEVQIHNTERVLHHLQEAFNLTYEYDNKLYLPDLVTKTLINLVQSAENDHLIKSKLFKHLKDFKNIDIDSESHRNSMGEFLKKIINVLDQQKKDHETDRYSKMKKLEQECSDKTAVIKDIWTSLEPKLELIASKEYPFSSTGSELSKEDQASNIKTIKDIRDIYLGSKTEIGEGVAVKINSFLKKRHKL